MLRETPSAALDHLLYFYNLLWMRGPLRPGWISSIVIPLLKPRKDPFRASLYRISALKSCALKTLESMVKTHLEWWLEYNELFPAYQFAFRRDHGCMDKVSVLLIEIYNSFSDRGTTTAVFLDLQQAYDSVNLPCLFDKLKANGIPKVFCMVSPTSYFTVLFICAYLRVFWGDYGRAWVWHRLQYSVPFSLPYTQTPSLMILAVDET